MGTARQLLLHCSTTYIHVGVESGTTGFTLS